MADTNNDSNEFLKEYKRLRTALDALEMTALRYCLNDNDDAERIVRAKELVGVLKPIITQFQNQMPSENSAMASTSGCPPGYWDCNGCCVPYQC